MATYAFLTTWTLNEPVDQVWAAIRDYQQWPEWWPAICEAKQIAPGDAEGIGEIAAFDFRTRLPYRVRFLMTTTHVKPPHQLDGRAVGELEGEGRWRLHPSDGGTVVTYAWEVRTTRWWMNLLAPVARPLFAWNHDQVMKSGEAGLIRLLAGRGAVKTTDQSLRGGH